MGRAIGQIVTLAGAVVVNVVPGLGQLASAAILIGSAVAGSALSSLLGPKAPAPAQSESEIKTERPKRVRGYGTSRRYGASLCFDTASNGTSVDVYAFHDGRAAQIRRVYLNDDQVTLSGNTVNQFADDRFQGGRVKVGWTLGAPTETAFSWIVGLLPGIWTNNHRGDGVVTGYLTKAPEKEKWFLETYPQGDRYSLSLVGDWTTVYDPRDGTQDPYNEATWKWTDNAALAFVHYLMVYRGYDWNTAFAPQVAKVIAAANDCDTLIPKSAGGSEKKYRTAFSYEADQEPANIIASLLACFDGWYVENERGEIVLYSGVYYTPTVSIGPDQIIDHSDQLGVEVENTINEIAIPYISDQHDYASVDATPWRDEGSISEIGRINTAELNAVVPSFTQGRRLAKRQMARSNAAARGTIRTTYSGKAIMGERYINLTSAEAGTVFYSGPAEIVSIERDPLTGGVTFEWAAVEPNIDAWNPATEDGDGAPVGNRVVRAALSPPTISSAYAQYEQAVDNSGTGVRVVCVITDPGLLGLTWYLRYRVDGASAWKEQEYPDTDADAGTVTLITDFIPVTDGLEVEVEYRASDGRLSGWSDPASVNTSTDATPPDNATGITLVSWTNALTVSSDPIARASTYRFRIFDPSDLTTPIRTINSATRSVSYASDEAALDGIRRSYVVTVAGVNSAGAGGEASTGTISKPAPPAATSVSATGGDYNGSVSFDLQSGTAGYSIYVATTSSFDPLTEGLVYDNNGYSPHTIYGLSADTYYTKVAAYDQWSKNPALLNVSSEISFTIAIGGGGGAGGGGGGGYCPEVDTLVLMADGTQKRAGDIVVGDKVWTLPDPDESPGADWGAYPVEAISFSEEPVLCADIGVKRMRATAAHRIWIGGGWVRMDAIGVSDGTAMVAKITVAEAHTYVSNGVLSHNVKYQNELPN